MPVIKLAMSETAVMYTLLAMKSYVSCRAKDDVVWTKIGQDNGFLRAVRPQTVLPCAAKSLKVATPVTEACLASNTGESAEAELTSKKAFR